MGADVVRGGGPALAFQLLLCPMLDDRHLTPAAERVAALRRALL
ncbi:hypothetical protein [Planotetraspora sp. GP83]